MSRGEARGHRPRTFVLRAAPVRMSYVGASHIDFLLADPITIPAEARRHYVEKIIYLPSYQVTDSKRRIVERKFKREGLGLPPQGFVFACFNANYKIMPATITACMRMLQPVASRMLFLDAGNPVVRRKLERNRATGLLFDTARFTRRLESAYVRVHERNQACLPSEHIFIEPSP